MRSLIVASLLSSPMFANTIPELLRPNLTLYASFDKTAQADVARGDRAIYSAPDYKQHNQAKPGLGDVDVAIESGAGVAGGGALRFKSKNTRALFFSRQPPREPRKGHNLFLAAG